MRRYTALVAAGLLATFVLVGCSTGNDAATTAGEDSAARAPADAGGGAADGPAADNGAPRQGSGITDAGGSTLGRQVIREASLSLESDDPQATVDAITAAARDAGGFVSDADLRRVDGILRGTVTLRVPADRLTTTLAAIEAAGADVVGRTVSSQDVTGEYTDIAAQLRNLRAVETQLLELLGQARQSGDTEQVLMVFDRIREIRDEIERLQGRQQVLDDLVAMATITVTVGPTPELEARITTQVEGPDPAWSPRRQIERAWDATVSALRVVVDLLIWLAVTALPIALVILVPLTLLGLLARALARRRRRPGRPLSPPPAPVGAPAGRTGGAEGPAVPSPRNDDPEA